MALRDYVLNNLGRKLVSLCLASLIWFTVSSVDRKEPRLLESPFGSLRSEEHTSELQSPDHLVCRLLLEKKNITSAQPASASPTTMTGRPITAAVPPACGRSAARSPTSPTPAIRPAACFTGRSAPALRR